MEDITFVNLQKRINKTQVIIESHQSFGKGPEESENLLDVILENQLAIMIAIDRLDDKINYQNLVRSDI